MTPGQVFLHPGIWPLLLAVPLACGIFWVLERARARRYARAIGPRAPVLAADLGVGRRRLRRALFCTALLLALVAFLQPAWGEATRTVEQRGVDLVVCLDVSRSMLARDLAPTRLLRARREIGELAQRAEGDRLALVLFAGEARLAVPLTRDRASFAALAAQAGPLSVEQGGSDLGAALLASLEALEGAGGETSAILLLTDGEDHEERGLRAARRCAERGVTVHCVGFGSTRGAKIPLEGEGGESFLRDRTGAEVVSALDATTLRRIADATGGAYADALERGRALNGLYDEEIEPMARRAFASEELRARENRYQWPLLAAFLCWILELCLSDRRR